MCRFFAILSNDPVSPLPALLDSPGSLLAKSRAKADHLQADGWGVGWFDGEKPKVFKQPGALFDSVPNARAIAGSIRSGTCVGHVRVASNPGSLPKKALIGENHTQPFQHEEWLFVHNGTLYLADEIREQLGSLARFILGRNDSEVLFYWLLKTLIYEKTGTYAERLSRGLQDIDQLWQRVRSRHPQAPYAYRGLNFVLTNGHIALCFCYETPNGFGDDKAFFSSETPWYQLHMQTDARLFRIASEPLDPADVCTPVSHGQFLVVRRGFSGLELEVGHVRNLAHV
jgi:predicted glutamine amidotransferase